MNAENSATKNVPEITVVADAEPGELHEIEGAVSAVVHTWWAECGLEGEPQLVVEARPGAPVGVLAAGMPLHLSAWRWEQALSVALGERRSASSQLALSAPDRAMQIWTESESSRCALAAEVVDAMLRAGCDEVLATAGISQSLPQSDAQVAPRSVAIELPGALARALTELPQDEIAAQASALITVLASRYGVTLPGVALSISDRDTPVVRLRYAGRATPPFLLSFTEPKSLLADVMRLAEWESPLHLGLWVSDQPGPWATGLNDLPTTAGRVAQYLPNVSRRLVEEQATVMNEQHLVEAILRVFVEHPESNGNSTELDMALLDAMEDRARLILGEAVLAHFTQEVPVQLIRVEDVPIAGRTQAQIREDLFAQRPELVHLTDYAVLAVSSPIRRAVALAMRPLADTFRVASTDELQQTSAALHERWVAIDAQMSAAPQESE
jgi:hypothetical protein